MVENTNTKTSNLFIIGWGYGFQRITKPNENKTIPLGVFSLVFFRIFFLWVATVFFEIPRILAISKLLFPFAHRHITSFSRLVISSNSTLFFLHTAYTVLYNLALEIFIIINLYLRKSHQICKCGNLVRSYYTDVQQT